MPQCPNVPGGELKGDGARMCGRSAIPVEGLRPAACRGMFDGMFEGFTTFADRAACLTS